MKRLIVLASLALSACGTLPQPFYGSPGQAGARLAIPPSPILVIPTPASALLGDDSAALFAHDLAAALVDQDVPSIAKSAGKADWRLTTTASLSGQNVIPSYSLTGPDGKFYGSMAGAPVPADGWANGDPAALNNAAITDSAPLTRLLAAANATVQGSNPESLENRPPRIFMGTVTGAPGDGDSALALNMARDLPGPNNVMVTDPSDADFTIIGVVKATPDTNGQMLVELDWMVHDSSKRKIGQVTQLHDLNPGDITPYWGDVAAAAATEGAEGVDEVIANATLHKRPAATPAPATGH